jgi:uncharacterized glyoxalase superfamily protein PhnB
MSSTIIPTMRYSDAPEAIEWLCKAFGFERHLVVPEGDDKIAHAQLKLGNAMIMLGSHRQDEFGRLMRLPREAGGCTQSAYVIVDDVDAHCERARVAGAEILQEPADQDYGGRLYTCKDTEGHVWSFGSFNPWLAEH